MRMVVAGMLVAALSMSLVPIVRAPGDAPEINPFGNLADMDGRSDPAAVSGQVINGTVAHVVVEVSTVGTYSLKKPDGTTVQTVPSVGKIVHFPSVELVPDGWWKVTTTLGAQVTSFEVKTYSGSLVGITSSQVIVGADELFTLCPPQHQCYPAGGGAFRVQTMIFDSTQSPKCRASGTSDPNQVIRFTNDGVTHIKVRITFTGTVQSDAVAPGDTATFRQPHFATTPTGSYQYWGIGADTVKTHLIPTTEPIYSYSFGSIANGQAEVAAATACSNGWLEPRVDSARLNVQLLICPPHCS